MSTSEQYANKILSSEIPSGRLMRLAAQRFINDLKRTDIYFDESEANKFIFFSENYCCLWEDKWRGKPVVILPWMAFIFQQIYGWFYTETKLRRVRKVYVQVAKKNAKSTLGGLLNIFHVFADERIKTPKVFVGANNEDQAKICVNITGKIIEQSPELYELVQEGKVDLFKYKENIVNIVHKERDGFIKAMSKESSSVQDKASGGKHGINASLGEIDEYAMADTDALLNTFESSQAAREEPLLFTITTAGHKQNGPCYQQLRRTAVDILEGISEDDTYLAFIFEMDRPLDEAGKPQELSIDFLIKNENLWLQCNPSLGVSVFPEFLRSRLKAAKNEGGTKAIDVLTYNFNQWCDTPEVWISTDTWNQNYHGGIIKRLEGRSCFGGLAIIGALDLNAFLLFFPNFDGERHAIRAIFWMPESDIRENKTKTDLSRWVDEGYIHACSGTVIDNDFVFERIMEEIKMYNIDSIAFNINNAHHDILQNLVRAGLKCDPLSQGYRGVSTPTKEWEALLTAGNIEHFNNPVLAWMNKNTIAIRKGDEIMVQKAAGKTSGITAAINAVAQYMTVNANFEDDAKIISW